MTKLAERLKIARKRAGLSQSELARRVGIKPQAIQAIESGRAKTTGHIIAISRELGCNPDWLGGADSEVETQATRMSANGVSVLGVVQAGVWAEEHAYMEPETQIAIPENPRYSGVRQYGLLVRGPSMNEIIGDGEYAHVVDWADLGKAAESGDIVVVVRERGGLRETSLKEVSISADGTITLHPRSTDPAFQKPLELDADGNATDSTVSITGLLVGKYSALR